MNDHDHALVVGINHYPELRPLEGAVGDALRFSRWLQTTAALDPSNIELVTSNDSTAGRPVLDEIDDAFTRIFRKTEDDRQRRRLYVYFAGHGAAKQLDHLALLMANADRQNLNRALNATAYRDGLARKFFPEQVYLFDCCRNFDDRVTGRRPEWTDSPGDAPIPGLVQIAFFAAGFTEYANERQLKFSERRGLFTTVLLEGLDGNAATASGDVTTDRLIHYVRERLDDLTRSEGVRQHFWLEERGSLRSLVLATGVAPALQHISVLLPPDTVRVIVRDDRAVPIAVQQIALGTDVAKFDLEMSYYSLTAEPSGTTSTLTVLPGRPPVVDLRGPGQ